MFSKFNSRISKIVLGSSSEPRRHVLSQAGIPFDVCIKPEIDETPKKREMPKALSRRLAKEKNEKCVQIILENAKHSTLKKNSVVVCGDTVMCIGRKILDKSETKEDTLNNLTKMSGKTVKFFSSQCVSKIKNGVFVGQKITTSETRIKMAEMPKDEIEEIVSSGIGIGTCGSFRIEGYSEQYIEKIIGSISVVMGISSINAKRAIMSFIEFKKSKS